MCECIVLSVSSYFKMRILLVEVSFIIERNQHNWLCAAAVGSYMLWRCCPPKINSIHESVVVSSYINLYMYELDDTLQHSHCVPQIPYTDKKTLEDTLHVCALVNGEYVLHKNAFYLREQNDLFAMRRVKLWTPGEARSWKGVNIK